MELCKVSQIMSSRCSSEKYLSDAIPSQWLPAHGSKSRWREKLQVVLFVFQQVPEKPRFEEAQLGVFTAWIAWLWGQNHKERGAGEHRDPTANPLGVPAEGRAQLTEDQDAPDPNVRSDPHEGGKDRKASWRLDG